MPDTAVRSRKGAAPEAPTTKKNGETPTSARKKSAREEAGEQLRAEMKLRPGALLNELDVEPIDRHWVEVCIIGTSPLLASHFPAKAMEQIVESQIGKKRPKVARNIDAEFEQRLCKIYDPKGPFVEDELAATVRNHEPGRRFWYAFSALTFKNAIVGGARMMKKGSVKMTELKPAVFVRADGLSEDSFEIEGRIFMQKTPVVKLETVGPIMRADHVRLAGPGGTADVRFRPEFGEWRCKLAIEFLPNVLSPQALYQLLVLGGEGGIGDWRAQKGGWAGQFRLASKDEVW
jgi:hypothetical protein